tara:strand:+ start:166 stop:399 length:234 start_codon:yes stop_codon:yes gene_type:complete
VRLDLYQSLQKNKVLFVLLVSESKQTILNEAFKEIGTCIKAINIRRMASNDGSVFNGSLFFEVNLFRELCFLNLMLD